jgi:pilus assembly protein CpaF
MIRTPAWLSDLLADSAITDICINGENQVFVDQGLGLEGLGPTPWKEDEIKTWVVEALSEAGKSWDARNPFADASLRSGHRLHVCFPPLASHGTLISLRRLAQKNGPTLQRWGQSPSFDFLVQAVRRGESILISGATGSGKTTLASDLLSCVPPQERMIALEDTPELQPHHPHFLSLVSRPPNADGCGEVTLRTLLRQTLRMRPDRIILGECRGSEVLDLLQALNTGHQGALATLHANSPRDALRRIELLCLISSEGKLAPSVIRELLAVGIQWLVQVRRTGGVRAIEEIWKLEGREGDTILLRPINNT